MCIRDRGVDALLGYQSRAHNDIDIFVEKNDYQNFIEIMKANGFYEIKICLLYTSRAAETPAFPGKTPGEIEKER